MSGPDPGAVRDAERRLAILRILDESPRRTAVEGALQTLLDRWGHSRGRIGLYADLDRLAGQGLVEVEEIGGVRLATLTRDGLDVALGREVVDGVARPAPDG